MVDYVTPMDQAYHSEMQQANRRTEFQEETIFPTHLIGQTVPESDMTGRNKNIVEGVDAAFRGGAGNIQLVMMTSPTYGEVIGGAPKAYGEEVRQALREVQRAAGAKITGVEMPTKVNNLSGFHQNQFSEEIRQSHLEEVKDAIKFIGDIAGGGTVDVVGFEFPRNFSESKWFDQEGKPFQQKGEEVVRLVDTDTGGIQTIDKRQKFFLPYDPEKGYAESKEFHKLVWSDFEKWAGDQSKETGKKIRAEELFVQKALVDQKMKDIKAREDSIEHSRLDTEYRARIASREIEKDLAFLQGWERAKNDDQRRQLMEQFRTTPEEAENDIGFNQRQLKSYQTLFDNLQKDKEQLKATEKEIEETSEKLRPIDEFATKKTTSSYAEAGVWAMQESQKNQYVQRGKGSISVGPELGWPQYYGGHPKEWVQTILDSREKMVERLTEKEFVDPKTEEKIKNPYFDPSISKSEAEKLAKQHIKGMFDTSHMGMWLQNFRTDLPWDKRVGEFKKWYKDEINWLAEQNKKFDVIGGIQMVDSASGQHGHLPPGQGIIGKDMFDYMKILKEKGGYKGEFTSEGHEEERFGQGRILSKAWETLGAPISTDYWHGAPSPRFRDIAHSYAQIAYGTTGIFRAYVPSNDFSLWSEVPFE